jgi:S-adenosyl-L-methionine hydrolase (adenosine-forming)
VVDALHDAPAFAIEPAAHLLAALAPRYPRKAVFFAVVDPGVGGARDAIVVQADGRSFVGPDNGLFSIVWQRGQRASCQRILWRPKRLSRSFHGRDLFAPVAAALATRAPRGWLEPKARPDVRLPAQDLAQVIYIDHYGNAMTGIRAASVSPKSKIRVNAKTLGRADTFETARGPFWHENSIGLVEISAPSASAAELLRLRVGSPIRISK